MVAGDSDTFVMLDAKLDVKCYWAATPGAPLTPATIKRRNPGPDDVVIDVVYAGICHSDIHQARNEWSGYWGDVAFPWYFFFFRGLFL